MEITIEAVYEAGVLKPLSPLVELREHERVRVVVYTEPRSERERATAALRAAGLLAEIGPEMKERASRSTATLEEVQAAFARSSGKPLSEIVIEQRGPKE